MSSRTQSSRLALRSQRRPPVVRIATLAKQPLENDPRMRFGRQRRRRRRPREIVLVDARVAVIALSDRLEEVHRHLQRRQQRLLSDLFRGNLIDGRAQIVVGAFGPLRLRRAEKRGVRRGVRARIRVLQLEVADDRELIHHRRQRLEGWRQLAEPALARRRPPREIASHRHVDEAKPTNWSGWRSGERRHRRHHRIEQRQRHGGAHTSEERPARQGLLGDDHRDCLI